jgi:hypothetical protein
VKLRLSSTLYVLFFIFFILYLIFSNYLFNVVIRDKKEDVAVAFDLPKENTEMFHSFTAVSGPRSFRVFRRGLKTVVEMSGWVFHANIEADDRLFYIVLKSNAGTVIIAVDRALILGDDLSDDPRLKGESDRVRFNTIFPTYLLKKSDVHQMGFVMKNSLGTHFHMTHHFLVENDGEWSLLLLEPHVLGNTILFDMDNIGSFEQFLVSGFGQQEQYSRWTISSLARILIPETDYDGGDLLLRVTASPYLANGHIGRQIVDVRVNNQHVTQWSMERGGETYRVVLPRRVIGENGRLDIVFNISNPASPAEFGLSEDSRRLGISFLELVIEKADRSGGGRGKDE